MPRNMLLLVVVLVVGCTSTRLVTPSPQEAAQLEKRGQAEDEKIQKKLSALFNPQPLSRATLRRLGLTIQQAEACIRNAQAAAQQRYSEPDLKLPFLYDKPPYNDPWHPVRIYAPVRRAPGGDCNYDLYAVSPRAGEAKYLYSVKLDR